VKKNNTREGSSAIIVLVENGYNEMFSCSVNLITNVESTITFVINLKFNRLSAPRRIYTLWLYFRGIDLPLTPPDFKDFSVNLLSLIYKGEFSNKL
jgi:hypothetical protein